MRFDRYLNEFEDYLVGCAFSERTIESYMLYAKRFTVFLATFYPRINSFEKITKEVIMDYQNYLSTCKTEKGERFSNQTQSLILRALKKLFYFLMKRDLILKDPTVSDIMINGPKQIYVERRGKME